VSIFYLFVQKLSATQMSIESAVDHVILYVGPRNANGQRRSEVVVFIEDKVCFSRSCFAKII
jgi:hypothetical protein